MTNLIRRKPIDSKPERKLITGLIVNDEFCEAIIPILKTHRNILAVSFVNIVAGWIIKYWDKYGHKTPSKYIKEIFDEKKNEFDEDLLELIEGFLTSLSSEYEDKGEDFNSEYEIDKTLEYLKARQIKNLQDQTRKASTEEAQKLIREFKPISLANDDDERKGLTSKEIAEMEIPFIPYLVDGIIPATGLFLFAGKPKSGKSSFIFNIALDVSLGRDVLNKIPIDEPAAVVYLALEDFLSRIQIRQKDILGDDDSPENLTVFYQGTWPETGKAAVQRLEKWMEDHPETKLIIVDTLQKIRDPGQKQPGQSYVDDYQALEALQEFAGVHQIALVVIHHSRKTKADDVFDEISGTTGLSAAADTLGVLGRIPGQNNDRILYIRGRDFADKEIIISLLSDYRWELKGDASEYLGSKERKCIISYLNLIGIPIQRAKLVEKIKHRVGKGIDVLIKKLLDRNQIEKVGYGIYAYAGYEKDQKLGKAVKKHRDFINSRRKVSEGQGTI